MQLEWPDYAAVTIYLLAVLGCGAYWARQQRTDDEYFLVGRRVPWVMISVSIVASMLSSITYLAEPGEVWKSGVTHVLGKLVGIPVAAVLVWTFCIPFMMRFRFTSAYEYLEHRFGHPTRRFGATLFVGMVVLWMGFVILVLSQVVHQITGLPLVAVILTVGFVATLYTMLGGLRAVIWTDLIQVALLVGGGVLTVAYIAWTTDSGPLDWVRATNQHLIDRGQPTAIPIFSWDPTVRATVVSVAINMAVWHICIHTSNQMTVQRYFSTRNAQAARNSFLLSALLSAAVTLLLVMVGLSVLYYYAGQGTPIDGNLDPANQRDLIFPAFAMHRLPAGIGGAMLAALLAAGMSTVDSGLNAIATVVSLELHPAPAGTSSRYRPKASDDSKQSKSEPESNHVRSAMRITAAAGALIALAAYAISFLPSEWGIVGAIPRTFNAVTGPLGGLFLLGIFFPKVGQRSAITATILGLLVSISLGYLRQFSEFLEQWGIIENAWEADISFAWILPCSLLATLVSAPLMRWLDRSPATNLAGLTWWTRNEAAGDH